MKDLRRCSPLEKPYINYGATATFACQLYFSVFLQVFLKLHWCAVVYCRRLRRLNFKFQNGQEMVSVCGFLELEKHKLWPIMIHEDTLGGPYALTLSKQEESMFYYTGHEILSGDLYQVLTLFSTRVYSSSSRPLIGHRYITVCERGPSIIHQDSSMPSVHG